MFWRKKRESAPPQIGCFGKLPATGDFIRWNASTDELAAFDHWLGGSLDFARRSLGASFDPAYQMAVGLFIFRGEAGSDGVPGRGLVGAWAASGDNAGRLYPMIVFASYDYGQLVAAGGGLPIALWPLLTSAYELVTGGRGLPVEAFVSRVQGLVPPSLEDPSQATLGYRSWLGSQTMQALWETCFGSESARFWVMRNVRASVDPFRGHELPRTGLGLRFPLGLGDAYAASVWMDMTVRMAKTQRTLPNAFWSPQQTLLLHLGPPHVASFREMIAPSHDAEHVADLCSPPAADDATNRRMLGPELDALVSRSDLTLASFLDGLT